MILIFEEIGIAHYDFSLLVRKLSNLFDFCI